MRADEHGRREERAGLRVAQRWAKFEAASRTGLGAGAAISEALGDGAMAGLTGAARAAIGAELVPEWEPPMPPPAKTAMPPTTQPGAAAVYLPACVNRIFGRDRRRARAAGDPLAPGSLPEALVAVSLRAGKPLWIPTGVAGTCCGTPWVSKGYRDGASWMVNSTVEDLWRWSDGGRLPVVIDASSCTHGLLESAGLLNAPNAERLGQMTILDSVAWAADHLLANLEVTERVGSAVVHPTCSGTHLGLNGELERLAGALAERGRRPGRGGLLRIRRRPRLPPPRAQRLGHRRRRRARSLRRTATPTSVRTGPARSG